VVGEGGVVAAGASDHRLRLRQVQAPNGLMGATADRLAYPDSAEELMRACWAYAIGHRPLFGATPASSHRPQFALCTCTLQVHSAFKLVIPIASGVPCVPCL